MFKLITRKTLAATAADRFARQYHLGKYARNGIDRSVYGNLLVNSLAPTYQKLSALPADPSPDQVNKIIGNTSWTSVPDCTECKKENAPFILQVGDEPDPESRTVWLCPDCCTKIGEIAVKPSLASF